VNTNQPLVTPGNAPTASLRHRIAKPLI
jgi:hypothetical protein